jgi:glycosyltransferase involved in cell wall biosynthesis
LLASRVSRSVSRIIACSQAAADFLLESCPALAAKTRVLYNPLSPLETPLPAPDGDPTRSAARFVLGMVGRITEEKGHQVLLRALAQLRTRLQSDVRLVIVGAPAPECPQDSHYARALESSATRLGLSGSILWAGYQANPGRHYAAMDVLVHPSTCKEGMPMVVLEALQRAVPVVASRIGGIPEVIQEGVNGLLVPPGNEAALTGALERLLADPTLRRQLGAGARASIDSRFSAKEFGRAIYSLVSELCSPA